MKKIIRDIVADSIAVKETSIRIQEENLVTISERLAGCLTSGHKIMIFGNGGSAADAQHIAAEFINRFRIERPPLAAIALTTDSSILTSIGNDYHFDDIFIKQVAALGQPGDIAWGISTSGNSKNVVKALEYARGKGIITLGMCGRGGRITELSELLLTVESSVTARIQETHITMGHILCELTDRILFPGSFPED
jgi:D-sedoheptulose 7-phosphate isomerase